MLKQNIKSAMTLGEVCLVFTIIGVIASLAVSTIKPFERSAKMLYNRIYNSLETAVYNSMLEKKEFPQTASGFCNMLLEFINSPANSCSTNVYSKNAENTITFDENQASMIASNGARFYIVGNNYANKGLLTHTETIDGSSVSVKYYLVYVDINGSKGRGTTIWSSKDMADVVGFVVTETGTVVPLGYPIIDTRYLTARVGYPLAEGTEADEDTENLSAPMTFFEAKHKAFGDTVITSDELTFNWQNEFPLGSLLHIPESEYPTRPSVDSTNKCSNDANSPCYIKIEEYE